MLDFNNNNIIRNNNKYGSNTNLFEYNTKFLCTKKNNGYVDS